jgi:hypothetical protein
MRRLPPISVRLTLTGASQLKVGDVRRPAGHVRKACCRNRRWARLEHVIHDRQVVDSEIPHHVNVVLEEAEIDSDRVVVVDVADLPGRNELPHLADGAGVNERVIHHQDALAPGRKINQPLGLFRGAGERLLH